MLIFPYNLCIFVISFFKQSYIGNLAKMNCAIERFVCIYCEGPDRQVSCVVLKFFMFFVWLQDQYEFAHIAVQRLFQKHLEMMEDHIYGNVNIVSEIYLHT